MKREAKWLVLGLLVSLNATASSHSLTQTKKVASNTYEGTAGKTRLVLITKGCYHETPEGGETSGFIWYADNGLITFANSDYCTVTSYKEK